MATKQTIEFARKHSILFLEPILEIGSKIHSQYIQYSPRSLHSQ